MTTKVISSLDKGKHMIESFKPLADRVLVEREETASQTPSGIIIPDKAKDRPTMGKVIAVGKGHSNKDGSYFPLSVSVGDKILFGKYNGVEITHDNKKYLLLQEEEILAIVE